MPRFAFAAALLWLNAAAQGQAPLDPQRVVDQQEMTWADYRPIPGVNWADPVLTPSKKQFRVALIAVDFPNQRSVLTWPRRIALFVIRQMDPLAGGQVRRF